MSIDRNTPSPLEVDDLTRLLARVEEGVDFRVAFEELLRDLPLVRAEHLMLLMRQGRAAWMPLLHTRRGRALFIGNAFSGASAGLAFAGWDVVVRDDNPDRLAFADVRARGLKLSIELELSDDHEHLPHADESFDLVVRDGPGGATVQELARVSRGEVVLIVDNRYGYKHSTGVHGEFRIRRPGEYLKSLLSSKEKSLAGHSAELTQAGLVGLRPYALYPDSRDFTFCVSLGDTGPTLPIGPKERSNRLKILAHRFGLFPHLTPSYALIANKPQADLARPLASVLLAEALGVKEEESPPLEHLVNTRGNNVLLLSGGSRPVALHLPMEARQRAQVEKHLSTLSELRERYPNLPVPKPLGENTVDGLWYVAEERLGGWSAGQICGDQVRIARMLTDVAQHFAALVTRPARPFTEEDCERLVGTRVRRVAEKAVEPDTIAALEDMEKMANESLVGAVFPLVRSHGDLRSKHVQVDREGRVLGYLDWGSTEEMDLPMFDLLHLLVHERKQEAQLTAGEAWRLLEDDRAALRPHERSALEGYAEALNLPEGVVRAVEGLYPLLVADVAEKNWDYSRPRWVQRQFGI